MLASVQLMLASVQFMLASVAIFQLMLGIFQLMLAIFQLMLAVLRVMLAVQMAEDIHIKQEAAFSDSLLFYLQTMCRSLMLAVMLLTVDVAAFTIQVALEPRSLARAEAVLSQAGFDGVYSSLLRFDPCGFARG